MRGEKKRPEIEKLFILGAGASHGSSGTRADCSQTPLDANFTQVLSDLKYKIPRWVSRSQALVLRDWKDPKDFASHGLEEAISMQICHKQFLETAHSSRTRNSASSFDYLNHLSHLVCFVLSKAKPNSNNSYQRLVDKHFNREDAHRERNRVISFNYDDLLDRILLEKYDPHQIYFDKIGSGTYPSPRSRQPRFPNPLLLKLHGSINWRCSAEAVSRILMGDQKTDGSPQIIEAVRCCSDSLPDPDESEYPLIVPPILLKPITDLKLFGWLWTLAYEYLHQAKEIVICGYSLPEADRFASSLFSNFSNETVKRITLVDPNAIMLEKWRNLLRRNNVNREAEWVYFENFAEYIERSDRLR
jgi:hypothetical protein